MPVRWSALSVCVTLFCTFAATADPLDRAVGKALFDRNWTSSPASTDATDGLGPLFNARSCVACHPAGGRGRFEEDAGGHIKGNGLVLRLGATNGNPDPTYGQQLQTLAVQGLKAEGKLIRQTYGSIRATALAFGPLGENTNQGGRLAPTLRGIGLLQSVSQEQILALADPNDIDKNGISGRINFISTDGGDTLIGRFGWKAGKASILSQSAAALNIDLGLSNPYFRDHAGECTNVQFDCQKAPHGDSPRFDNLEINQEMLRLISVYVAGLKPPAPSSNKAGLELFTSTGCAACHQPELKTRSSGTIAAYTDLLLHDMGDKLADGIGDSHATGREWRTAPLWGLGAATRFLHDGRASSLDEAICWHGGEASQSKMRYQKLSISDQQKLLKFLSGL